MLFPNPPLFASVAEPNPRDDIRYGSDSGSRGVSGSCPPSSDERNFASEVGVPGACHLQISMADSPKATLSSRKAGSISLG
jgi:hypothetical protein